MEKNTSRVLVIVYSYHHMNTKKVADEIASVLNAAVKTPGQLRIEELQDYDIIGLGAGIDSGHHYQPLLDLAGQFPVMNGKKVFIFSTSAVIGGKKIETDHSALRDILVSKGYTIVDEFHCRGYNTNSFLKLFGGMNRGRPNAEDLKAAADFAKKVEMVISSC